MYRIFSIQLTSSKSSTSGRRLALHQLLLQEEHAARTSGATTRRWRSRVRRPTMTRLLTDADMNALKRAVAIARLDPAEAKRVDARLAKGTDWTDVAISCAYSITSSAVASSDGGMSRPSALAVLRLIINSTFVDCMTGRSAGFSPLRTRPT